MNEIIDIDLKGILDDRTIYDHHNSYFGEGFGMILHTRYGGLSQFVPLDDPYRIREYGINIVNSGTAHYQLSLKEYDLKRGDIVLCAPRVLSEIKSKSDDFDMTVISLVDQLYDPHGLIFGKMPVGSVICISTVPDFYGYICNLVQSLWLQLHTTPDNIEVTSLLYVAIYKEVIRLSETQEDRNNVKDRNSKMFDRFIQLVNLHGLQQHRIEFYADKLCVTPNYLSNVIKKTSGLTVMNWIDRNIIMAAKAMLRHSNKTMQEITDELHFPGTSYFSRYFKRHAGISPLEYRKK